MLSPWFFCRFSCIFEPENDVEFKRYDKNWYIIRKIEKVKIRENQWVRKIGNKTFTHIGLSVTKTSAKYGDTRDFWLPRTLQKTSLKHFRIDRERWTDS